MGRCKHQWKMLGGAYPRKIKWCSECGTAKFEAYWLEKPIYYRHKKLKESKWIANDVTLKW